tara:strand:- start:546 stop:878 length:333 start_codon:yes stop_codon:yes gene_type:complete
MEIKIEDLNDYKVDENKIITESDENHIKNYKQLTAFFESALADATLEGKTDFPKLLGACMQCIRYLDSIVNSYETELLAAKKANNLIDTIIKNNTPIMVGNEESEQSLQN